MSQFVILCNFAKSQNEHLIGVCVCVCVYVWGVCFFFLMFFFFISQSHRSLVSISQIIPNSGHSTKLKGSHTTKWKINQKQSRKNLLQKRSRVLWYLYSFAILGYFAASVYACVKGHLEPTHLKSSPLFTFSTKSLGQDSPSVHLFSKIIGSRFTTAKIKLGEDSPSWFVFSRPRFAFKQRK